MEHPRITAAAILLSSLGTVPAGAQQPPDGQWHYLVQPYIMFPNMKGETGVGDIVRVHVDEDPQDIFDNLQMGAMFYAEARNDSWTFSTDLLYMDLGVGMSTDEPGIINAVDVSVAQLGWELAAMRRLTPNLELGLGLTYNQIDVDIDISVGLPGPPSQLSVGGKEEWIDPTIVGRGTWPINDHWFLQARANLGGFGVGSDLMWQLMADVGYQPSESWFFTFGYRVIDFDYDQGSGPDRFVYDMRTFGPLLRLGFNF
jgi:opacity protein-like surface antigen